jgi:hypothetical protein
MIHTFLACYLDDKLMSQALGYILYVEARHLLGEKLPVMKKFFVKLESVVSFTVYIFSNLL